MTRLQVGVLTAGVGIVVGGLVGWLLFNNKQDGDSPVRVAGGSIHMLEDGGWKVTPSSSANCASGMVDTCSYVSKAIATPTNPIKIENVTDGAGMDHPVDSPIEIPTTGSTVPWTINIYTSKDDTTEDMTNGVSLCSSDKNGVCDTSTAVGSFVTISPLPNRSGGFYPNETKPKERRFHNPSWTSCPNNHCEDMNTVAVTFGSATTTYTCDTSVECKIKFGQKR